jgi:hypothetical protein
MARFNEILTGRYNRYLQKLLQMKGGPPAAQLATEITPNFDIEHTPVETRILMGFERFWFAANAGPSPGVISAFQIQNLGATGMVAIIESLIVSVGVASEIDMSISFGNPAALTNAFASTRQDSRGIAQSTGTGTPIIVSSFGGAIGQLPIGIGGIQLAANTPFQWIQDTDQQIMLAPSTAIRIQTLVVNDLLIVQGIFRQRFLEDSELLIR